MDQHLPSAVRLLSREAHALLQHLRARRLEVGRREMQKFNSRRAQPPVVVAILLPKVDDGTDTVLARKLARPLDREAAADSKLLGQPVEIRFPPRLLILI
jgi:hypothetical protein